MSTPSWPWLMEKTAWPRANRSSFRRAVVGNDRSVHDSSDHAGRFAGVLAAELLGWQCAETPVDAPDDVGRAIQTDRTARKQTDGRLRFGGWEERFQTDAGQGRKLRSERRSCVCRPACGGPKAAVDPHVYFE